MADAHLPNSHPDVTPDWIEPSKPLTPFSKALQTTLVPGTENVWEGFIARDWCTPSLQGLVAHGGLASALMMSTSKKYFSSSETAPKKNQLDPIHLHVQFLTPLLMGKIRIELKELKIGSKHSVVQSTIFSSRGEACVVGIITHGSFDASSAWKKAASAESAGEKNTNVANIEIEQDALPDRVRDCARWTSGTFFATNPLTVRYRCYTVTGGPNHFWSPRVGREKRDMWMKIDDEKGGVMGLEHLGVIADLVQSIPLNFEKEPMEAVFKWAFATVCFSLDIKRDPEGEEWLLQRTVLTECANGRAEYDVKLIDAEGRLVATSKQVCMIIPVIIEDAVPFGGKEDKSKL